MIRRALTPASPYLDHHFLLLWIGSLPYSSRTRLVLQRSKALTHHRVMRQRHIRKRSRRPTQYPCYWSIRWSSRSGRMRARDDARELMAVIWSLYRLVLGPIDQELPEDDHILRDSSQRADEPREVGEEVVLFDGVEEDLPASVSEPRSVGYGGCYGERRTPAPYVAFPITLSRKNRSESPSVLFWRWFWMICGMRAPR